MDRVQIPVGIGFCPKIVWDLAGVTRGSFMSFYSVFVMWSHLALFSALLSFMVFWFLDFFLTCLVWLDVVNFAANVGSLMFMFFVICLCFSRNSSFNTWISDKSVCLKQSRAFLVLQSEVGASREVRTVFWFLKLSFWLDKNEIVPSVPWQLWFQ